MKNKVQIYKLLKKQRFHVDLEGVKTNFTYMGLEGIWAKCKDSKGDIHWFSPLDYVGYCWG